MNPSLPGFVVIVIAVMLASCLQGSIGFGMGMLAAPVVAVIDPGLVPGTLIMLATLLTLLVVLRERTAIDLRGAGWALLGRVPGTVAGAVLLTAIPERALAILIAAVVLCGVAVTSLGWIPEPRRRNLVLAGATSGVLGTATSIGGPPMALVWQRSTGAQLRATMSSFFLIGSILSVAMLAVTGSVDRHTVQMFAVLIPATMLGYVLSRYANRILNPQRQRWTAITASTAGAVVLVVQQTGLL
ncbi:sulfite exporter TauE/SafE family protein [Mycobacterium sp. NPDC003323]